MRLLISRTPKREGKVYLISSEDNSLLWEVELDYLDSRLSWQLTFSSNNDKVTALMLQDSLNFSFDSARHGPFGRAREAAFSMMGKSIVEGENGNVIGYVRQSGLGKMTLLTPEQNQLGKLTRDKVPVLLLPSKAHLARQYSLETTEETFDVRLILCAVCRLIAFEYQSRSSG